jgi:hypothetical protein
MPGPFTVTVAPKFLVEGEHKGHLESVHFVATDGISLHRWWRVNTGTLDDDFRAIFGDWGPGILARLRSGETLKLPRPLALEEIRFKIGGAESD